MNWFKDRNQQKIGFDRIENKIKRKGQKYKWKNPSSSDKNLEVQWGNSISLSKGRGVKKKCPPQSGQSTTFFCLESPDRENNWSDLKVNFFQTPPLPNLNLAKSKYTVRVNQKISSKNSKLLKRELIHYRKTSFAFRSHWLLLT